ncbi:MAG: hypothetical protein ACREEM_41425, partial [Blastocatellia bacterium]
MTDMNKRQFLQTCTVLLAAQVADPHMTRGAEKKTAATAATPAAGGRRPLYFTTAAIARLRQQLAADRSLDSHWSALLARADALVLEALVPEEEARRPALRGVALQGRYRSHSTKQLVAMSTTLG